MDEKYKENYALLLKAQTGDEEAVTDLLKLNAGLVRSIALRHTGRGTDFEDLEALGNMGLLKAIRSFDTGYDRLTKGVKYRYGKLPIDAINNFKMNIEKHYMSPITQVAQLRKQAIEEAKNFIMSKSTTGKEKFIRKQIKYLFDHIPDNSYKAFLTLHLFFVFLL